MLLFLKYLGDHWEYTFPVAAKQGDVINYWVWGEKQSQGETLTGQTITLGRKYFTNIR